MKISTFCHSLLFKQIRVCTCTKEQKKFRGNSQSENIFLAYGVPNTIQHDQGPEFTSKVVKLLRGIAQEILTCEIFFDLHKLLDGAK